MSSNPQPRQRSKNIMNNGSDVIICFRDVPFSSLGSPQCSTETPLGTSSQVVHVVFMFLCSYFVPLCIIGVSYVSIFGAVRRYSKRMRTRAAMTASAESLNTITTQNQVAITVFIMIIVFLVCWSPLFIYLMYLVITRAQASLGDTAGLVVASYWMAFLNSALNPYIYGVRDPRVRRVVRRALLAHFSSCRHDVTKLRARDHTTPTDVAMEGCPHPQIPSALQE